MKNTTSVSLRIQSQNVLFQIFSRFNATLRLTTLIAFLLGISFTSHSQSEVPTISTFAGNGSDGYSGDGGPATAAEFEQPLGVVVDAAGNVYIADYTAEVIRKVNTSGIISTVVGNGTMGYSGDGGPASAAEINSPQGMAIDASGNLYIADFGNNRIRKVSTSGIMSTVAGGGSSLGDGGPATAATLNTPLGVAFDASGNLYIADDYDNRVRIVNTSGIINTFAGTGAAGYPGDGGQATATGITDPVDVAVDPSGNVYIADQGDLRYLKVNTSGIITTIAGNGTSGNTGDGGPASAAEIQYPISVKVDGHDNVYIVSNTSSNVRIINSSGIINAYAGTGTSGFSGDGGPATAAELYYPYIVSVTPSGNKLYIADAINYRIRLVTAPFFNVTAIATAGVICDGGSNGSAIINTYNGTSPYTYSWSPIGGSNATATGLSAGTYSVTVTDGGDSTATATVIITQPVSLSIRASVISSNACTGGGEGNATVSASGGTSPYTYSWSTGSTTSSTGSVLSAGTYMVSVLDNCGTSASATVIMPSSGLRDSIVTSSVVNISCSGTATGQATVGVMGGASPYNYSWSNGVTSGATSTLNAGSYSVTVTDANGCTVTASGTITQPYALRDSTLTSSIVNVSCSGESTGSASVGAKYGVLPYTYSWSGGGGNNSSASNLSAGNYTVTVQDACDASVTTSVTITQPGFFTTPTITSTNVTCIGGSNGTASTYEGSTSGTKTFSYTGAIQNFTVPGGVTQVTITLAGAQGGQYLSTSNPGGDGASFTGVCTVTGGHVLSVVVGGAGVNTSTNDDAGGGGGASWIYDSSITGAHTGTPSLSGLIAVAAGGGGAGYNGSSYGGAGGTNLTANTTTSGYTENSGGGTGGNGGAVGNYITAGAAGAGWLSNGGTDDSPTILGGNDWASNFASATGYNGETGGFGGGGGGGGNGVGGGGGGGGYNGGGGGLEGQGGGDGGGGGSFFNTAYGSLPATVTATNTGNGSVTISYPSTISGAYTYSWSSGQTTTSISGLSAGTYTVTVESNCGASISASVIITQPNTLSATATAVSNACNGTSNGNASATPSGGTSPYTYSWSTGVTSNSTGATLGGGTYTVTVHDNCGNSATASVAIQESPVMNASTNITSTIACNGGSTGGANVGTSGGVPPYTYSWSNGVTSSATSALSAGNYSVTVMDNNGCTTTSSVTITQPSALRDSIITSSIVNISCSGLSTGSATVGVKYGVSPYTYSWSGGAGNNSSASNLSAETYTVTVQDACGNSVAASVTITQPGIFTTPVIASTNVTCIGGSNGSASAGEPSSSGGTSNYSYNGTVTNGTGTVQTFTVPSGVTQLSITLAGGQGGYAGNTAYPGGDGAGFTGAVSVTPGHVLGIVVGGQGESGVTAADGGGGGGGSYVWDENTTTLLAVAAGGGGTGWSLTTGFAAGGIDLTGNSTTNSSGGNAAGGTGGNGGAGGTVASSNGNAGGGAGWISNGGNATDLSPYYSYGGSDMANGFTGGEGYNNDAYGGYGGGGGGGYYGGGGGGGYNGGGGGNYSPTTPGGGGGSYLIEGTTNLIGSATATNTGNGSVVISYPTIATGAYTYSWSNGQTTSSVTGLSAGTYTVTIVSSCGASASSSVTITQPNTLSVTATGSSNACNGTNNGNAVAFPSGGTSPYTYSWSNGITSNPTGATLSGGTYTITVEDNCENSASTSVIIQSSSLLTATTSVTSGIACNGASAGAANVGVTGGVSPYTYSWSNGNTSTAISALNAGTYSVTVTDNNGCTTTASATITQPVALSATTSAIANVICYGQSTGSASVTASNGSSPYTYSWAGGLGNNTTISNLSAGIYTVTVQDNCSASVTATVTITQPAAITTPVIASTNVTCIGGNNGSASASELASSGGNQTFSYTGVIQHFAIPEGISQVTVSVTGAAGGANDYEGNLAGGPGASFTGVCSVTAGHILSVVVGGAGGNANASEGVGGGGGASWVYDSTAQPGHSGTPSLSTLLAVAGGGGGTGWDINDAGAAGGTNLSTNLTTTGTGDDSQPGSSVGGTGGNGGEGGQASPGTSNTDGGGTGGAGWLSNGENSTVTTPTYYGGNDWANSFASIPSNYSYEGGTGGFGGGGASGIDGGGGGGGYNGGGGGYEGLGGAGGGGGGSFFNTAYGSLPATVTATNTGNGSVTIYYNAIAAGAYTYSWSNGATTTSIAGLSAGTYTLTLENSCGASASASVTITQPNALSVTASVITGACNGTNNGSASASLSGGTSPYTYSWSNGTTTAATGDILSEGTYTVTVHDNCGNSATASVNIIQSPVMTATTSVTAPILCNGGATGAADVGVSGGISPYTYSWSEGGGTNATINTYSVAGTDNFSFNGNLAAGTGTIQTFTVPAGVTQVSITVTGAQGGDGNNTTTNVGADGAGFTGIATVTPGHVLGIVVGGMGDDLTTTDAGGGGGGGTYVWDENTTTLIAVAGGGGGAGYSVASLGIGGTNLTTNATTTSGADSPGGTGGNGGTGGAATYGAGGAGWLSNGGAASPAAGGSDMANGFTGGSNSSYPAQNGGYGGGGGGGYNGGAGGGGYNGGGGSNGDYGGGGGGSYFNTAYGSLPTTVTATNTGNGSVAISYSTLSGTGIIAGTYSVTITDNNGCTTTASVSITQPGVLRDSIVTVSIANVACTGQNTGSATVGVKYGTAPYTYSWSSGEGTYSTASTLSAGTFTVTVQDNCGTSVTASVIITQPSVLTTSAAIISPNACSGGNNGNAQAFPAGGSSPYTYSWSNGTTNAATGSVLGAGTYTVTVHDNCGASATALAVMPSSVLRDSIIAASIVEVRCNGGANGTATVGVKGGAAPYTYSWDDGGGTNATINSSYISGSQTFSYEPAIQHFAIPAGVTQVSITVTGAQGGYGETTTYIGGSGASFTGVASVTPGHVLSVVVGAIGQEPTTDYGGGGGGASWVYDSTEQPGHSGTPSLSSLIAVAGGGGAASYYSPGGVEGGAGGTNLTTNATTTGPTNASTSPGGTGGSGGGGGSSGGAGGGGWFSIGTGVSPATGGNDWVSSFAVATDVTYSNNGGYGGGGAGNDDGGGGGGGYNGGGGGQSGYSGGEGGGGGSFFNTAYGSLPGTVTATNSGNGSVTISYLVGNPAGLIAGTYTVNITDANDCITTASVTITQPGVLRDSIVSASNISCTGSTGSATVGVKYGTAPYTYSWSNGGGTNATATGISTGTYTVTVTDNCSASVTASISITQPAALSIAALVTNACTGIGVNQGNAQVVPSGGVSPYTYSWSTGNTTSSTGSVLSPGTYTISVNDNCGTTSSASVIVPASTLRDSIVTASIVDDRCNGGTIGSAMVGVNGGSSPYTYSWSSGGGTNATINSYSLAATVNFSFNGNLAAGTGTVQTFTVPVGVTQLSITVNGAQGGDGDNTTTLLGADGAGFTGVATVTPGHVLGIVVGGMGDDLTTTDAGGGGGGGTYVWDENTTTLIAVAGGGGGAGYSVASLGIGGTNLTTNATTTSGADSPGGTGGNGGTGGAATYGAGGAGWLSNGGAASPAAGGSDMANGFTGGSNSSYPAQNGGYGGGGGGGYNGGAGGGGYNGGGGSNGDYGGGGGGSYFNTAYGSLPTTVTATNTGNGSVAISYSTLSGTGIIAGTYSVTITDNNGCTTTASVSITQPAVLSASASITANISCYGQNNGSLSVTASNGTSPYTYSWSGGLGANTSISGLSAGTYTVTVQDNCGASITASVNLTQPAAVTAPIVTYTNVTCNSGSNGSAIAQELGGSGGNKTFSYTGNIQNFTVPAGVTQITVSVTGGGGGYGENSAYLGGPGASFTGVASVTSGHVLSVVVGQLGTGYGGGSGGGGGGGASWVYDSTETGAHTGTPALSALIAVAGGGGAASYYNSGVTGGAGGTNLTTNASTSGTVGSTAGGTGGNGGAAPTLSGSGGAGGGWISNGGFYTAGTGGNDWANSFAIVTPVTYGAGGFGGGGAGEGNGGGGGGGYNGGGGGLEGVGGGCGGGGGSYFNTAYGSLPTNATATNTGNGSVTIMYPATAGGAYTYTWSPGGQTGSNATGLSAGTYTVTAENSCGASATASVIITQPNVLTASAAPINGACNGSSNGNALASPSGGASPYTYSWSYGGTANPTGAVLSAGTYSVTIHDNCGNSATASVNIIQSPVMTATTTVTTALVCNGANTGVANVGVTGGISPYTYSWSSGGGTNSTINSYSLAATQTFSYTGAIQTFTVPVGVSQVSITLAGAQGGEGDASASYLGGDGAGFIGVVTVTPNHVLGIVTGGQGLTTTTGAPGGGGGGGSYVWDENTTTLLAAAGGGGGAGYSTTGTAETGGTNLSTNATTSISSDGAGGTGGNGGAGGSATAPGGGGAGWLSNGGNGPSGGSGGNDMANGFTGGAGNEITSPNFNTGGYGGGGGGGDDAGGGGGGYNGGGGGVGDEPGGGGGSYLSSYPSGLISGPTATNTGNGSVVIAYSGISNTGLVAGTYTVTITDNNNCSTTASVTITQPNALRDSIVASSIVNIACAGQNTGSASVGVKYGTSPYTYSWSNGVTTPATGSILSAGTYTVTVRDNCAASVTASVTITQAPVLTAPTITYTSVTCNGGSNGSASILASAGGTSTYSYEPSIQHFAIPAGVTQVTISITGAAGGYGETTAYFGGDGASFTGVATVTGGHVLSVVVGGVGASDGTDETGGGGGASWVYDSTEQPGHTGTPSLSSLIAVAGGGGAGAYSAGDGGGAGGTNLITNATTTGTNGVSTSPGGTGGAGGGGGSSGGAGGAGWFSIGTGVSPATGGNDWASSFAVATDVTYNVNGGYGGGGAGNDDGGGGGGGYNGGGGGQSGYGGGTGGGGGSFFNTAYGSLPTSATATNTGNGTVSITYPAISGAGYTYSWSPGGQTTSSVTGLAAGTYTITMSNSCGSSVTASVTITQPNTLSTSASAIVGACNGSSNGNASATPSGGTSPYTYSWSNGSSTVSTSNPTGAVLAPGTYTVTVKDNCGNSATASVNIIQSPVMTATTSVTAPILCNGGATGAADVGVSGGISPYTYSWSEGGGTNATINTYSVAGTDNFSFNGNLAAGTGTIQTFTVPAGVTQVSITVTGAQGGDGNNTTTNVGADGAGFTGIATVTPGHVLGIVVGGMGDDLTTTDAGGGGGGGTYVWDENTTTLIAVAGGGGGAGYSVASLGIGGTNLTTNATTTSGADSPGGTGGNGGTGGAATYGAGGAGWLSNGGAASPAAGGSDMANGFTGGSNSSYPAQNGGYGGGGGGGDNGGAGGGGYNGGGGSNGDYGGGGGGSYFNTAYGSLPTTVTATNTGNGSVAISYSTLSGTGIIAGTYSVTITDNNGCTTTASVTITQPNALRDSIVTSSIVNVACAGQNTGSATVGVKYGTSPYTYSWSNGVTTPATGSVLSAGTYTVTVRDNCAASVTASVTITQAPVLTTPTITYTSVTCNGGSNGSASVLSSPGGTSSYSYLAAVQTFTVPAGVSQITLTLTGGAGGNGENSSYLGGAGASFTGVASVTGGHVLGIVTGGQGQPGNTYVSDDAGGGGGGSYVWDENTTTLLAAAAGGGGAGWDASNGGAGGTNLTTNATTQNATSNAEPGGSNGAGGTVVGGAGGGAGWLSNGANDGTVLGGSDRANGFIGGTTQLSGGYGGFGGGGGGAGSPGGGGGGYNGGGSGTSGAEGGGGGGSFFNTAYGSLPTNATATNTGNGSVTIMYPATAGGAYTYTWSPGGQTGSNATGLSAGTYTVTAENSCGASATASVIITQPNVLTASAAPINGACNGSSNGNALASPSGGASPYTYSWSYGGTANPTGAVLSAGTYSVTIHDNCGNSATASVNIIQSPVMTATTSVTAPILCNGGATGAADVGVSGGISPYTYSWSEGGGTNATINTYSVAGTDNFSFNGNLAAGTGTIQTFTVPAGVTQVSITVTGAQGGDGNNTTTNVGADGAGFTGIATVTPGHVLGIVVGGMGDDLTTTDAGGGGGGGTYVWDENTTTLIAVAGGGGGAGYSVASLGIGGTNLTTNATTTSGADSPGGTGGNGGTGGAATYGAGGAGWLSNGGAASPAAGGSDMANGFTGGSNSSYPAQNGGYGGGGGGGYNGGAGGGGYNGGGGSNGDYGGGGGGSYFNTAYGSLPTTVTATNTGNGSVAISYSTLSGTGIIAGTYSVTITDNNGCTTTASVTLTQPIALSTTTSVLTYGCGGNSAQVSATPLNGTSPYTYSWSAGGGTNSVASNLGVGTYTVTVHDNCDASATASVTITQTVALSITASVTNACSGVSGEGNALVVPSGGSIPYTYSWSNGATTAATGSVLSIGTYTVTVQDFCGSSASTTVIMPSSALRDSIVAASTVNVTCTGGATGSAVVGTNGGTSPYTYSWSGGGGTNATINSYSLSATKTFSYEAAIQHFSIPAGITQVTISVAGAAGGEYSTTAGGDGASFTGVATVTSGHVLSVVVGGVGVNSASYGGGGGGASWVYDSTEQPGHTGTPSLSSLIAVAGGGGGDGHSTTDLGGAGGTNLTTNITTSGYLSGGVSVGSSVGGTGGNGGVGGQANTGGSEPEAGGAGGAGWFSNGTNSSPELGGNDWASSFLSATGYNSANGGYGGGGGAGVDGGGGGGGYNGGGGGFEGGGGGGGGGGGSFFNTAYGSLPATVTATNTGNGSVTISYSSISNTGLVAGTYSVNVTDASGCIVTASVTITQPGVLRDSIIIASTVNISCNGGSNGSATVGVKYGTSPYTYSWSGGGGNNATASGLGAGTYTVTVNDNCGATATASVTVTQPNALSATASAPNITCYGNTVTATASPSNGTSPYTYSWSGGGGTNSTASGLSAGTYTVTVQDNCNATATASVTITQPNALSATASQTAASYPGESIGSAIANPSGGNSPYTYSWSPYGGTNSSASGLSAGVYIITVQDNCGASATASVTITQPSSLSTGITILSDAGCSGGTIGNLSATPSGGAAPYTYSWSNGSTSNPTGATLSAGTYTVTVEDNFGSIARASATIHQSLAIVPTAFAATNVSCYGLSNGVAKVSLTGGKAPFVYSWSNGGSTYIASGLSAGTYSVTITDSNNCSNTAAVTITQPTLLKDSLASITYPQCNGTVSNATIGVTGGTSPYRYSWSPNVSTTATAAGLTVRSYVVQVKDNNGCYNNLNFSISQPAALRDSIVKSATVNVSCSGGSATVGVKYGTSPYTYSWSSGGGSNANATGLSAGTYIVTINDAGGCTVTTSVSIGQPSTLSATAFAGTNISCNGGANGVVKASVSGGTSPYIYSWSPGSNSTYIASGLSVGTYTVTVSDNCGASATSSVTLTQPSALSDSVATISYPLCTGGTGSATIGVSGGTSPYKYTWSPNVSTTASATGLTVRGYVVQVKDNNGCYNDINFSLTQPATLRDSIVKSATVNISCNGASAGSATAGVKYGTTPYTYSWSPAGGNSATAIGLSGGTYTVTVSDGGGCTVTASVNITQPAALSPTAFIGAGITCNGASNGTAKVSVSGGSIPYTYSWLSPASGSTYIASGLSAGTYTVTVSDNCGASASSSVTVTEPAILSDSVITSSVVSPPCSGGGTGSAAIGVTGGTSPYRYTWSPNVSTTDSASGLTVRGYVVQVKDKNGCYNNITFNVTCSSASETVTYNKENGASCCPSSDNINLYPNPNTGQFTLSGLQQGMILEMYDYTGKMISTMTTTNESMQLNIFNQANGVYLIRILDKDGNLVGEKKVVKTQ